VIILAVTLVVASLTDLRSRVIPNWLVALAGAAGLGLALNEHRAAEAALSGALAAAPFLLASMIRPEGMGMGDVKLVAVIGLYLEESVWVALAIGLGLAGLAGVLMSLGKRLPPSQTALPLAPFLALGAGLTLVIGGNSLQ
jgi:leader peptidase (prepilin peptidase)/N-methyltransferase